MIGACYFIGIIIATSIVPVGYLSDLVGRKQVFICNVLLTILGCTWLYIANDVEHLWIGMLILGMTSPGRMIVATALADEFLDNAKRVWLLPMTNIANGIIITMTALYYQYISRDIKYIQLGNMALLVFLLFSFIIFVPESPKWLLSKGRYDEARESFLHVARFNGQFVTKADLVFDTEVESSGPRLSTNS